MTLEARPAPSSTNQTDDERSLQNSRCARNSRAFRLPPDERGGACERWRSDRHHGEDLPGSHRGLDEPSPARHRSFRRCGSRSRLRRASERHRSEAALKLPHGPEWCRGQGDVVRPGLIAIGLCLTLIHLVSIPVMNTSVNPARPTCGALFAEGPALGQLWPFWLAPQEWAAIGALIWRGALEKEQAAPSGFALRVAGSHDLRPR